MSKRPAEQGAHASKMANHESEKEFAEPLPSQDRCQKDRRRRHAVHPACTDMENHEAIRGGTEWLIHFKSIKSVSASTTGVIREK